jgi:hypothetical protein
MQGIPPEHLPGTSRRAVGIRGSARKSLTKTRGSVLQCGFARVTLGWARRWR